MSSDEYNSTARSFPRVSLRLPWAGTVVPFQGTSESTAIYAGDSKREEGGWDITDLQIPTGLHNS